MYSLTLAFGTRFSKEPLTLASDIGTGSDLLGLLAKRYLDPTSDVEESGRILIHSGS